MPPADRPQFRFSLLAIVILGLFLRLLHYDILPAFNETADEFMYPWAGISLLTTGTPTSWSGVQAYQNRDPVTYWGKRYPFVTPWVHKPLLYPIITGSVMLATGVTDFDQVRLTTLRLIPIAFSAATIILIAVIGRRLYHPSVGLMAAALYATIPTIVIANRLSLIENALTPLLLGIPYLLSLPPAQKKRLPIPPLIGLLCALAILLKQIGLAAALAAGIFYLTRRQWKATIVALSIAALGAALYVGPSWWYAGAQQFIDVNLDLGSHHNRGLPRLVEAIFQKPRVTYQASAVSDPNMLAGYVLLFSAPWWLPTLSDTAARRTQQMLLLLPFSYLLILLLVASGSLYLFGWHLYPVFPFLTLFLARGLYLLYKNHTTPQIIAVFLLFSPLLTQWLRIFPDFSAPWQLLMAGGIVLTLAITLLRQHSRQLALSTGFVFLLLCNMLTVYHGPQLFPTGPQPASSATSVDSPTHSP